MLSMISSTPVHSPRKANTAAGMPGKQIKTVDIKPDTVNFTAKNSLTKDDLAVISLRDKIVEKLAPREIAVKQAEWDHLCNNSEESLSALIKASNAIERFYQSKKHLKQFRKLSALSPNVPELQRHQQHLLKRVLREINEEETYPQPSYSMLSLFRNGQKTINGKAYGYRDLVENIQAYRESDPTRQKFVDAIDEMNAERLEKLSMLAKERNAFAQEQGYTTFFDYILDKNYGIKASQFEFVQKKIESIGKEAFKKVLEQVIKEDESPIQPDLIKKAGGIEVINAKLFSKMGFELNKLPINFHLEHNALFRTALVNPSKSQAGVMANSANTTRALELLQHETGHALYYASMGNDLHYLDRDIPSQAFSEGIALLMENLPYREPDHYKAIFDLSDDQAKSLPLKGDYHFACDVLTKTINVLVEKEIYDNPDISYQELKTKRDQYFNRIYDRSPWDHHWLPLSIAEHPFYSLAYLKGYAIEEQLYQTIKQKFDSLSTNPDAWNVLKAELFAKGCSKTEDQLLKDITGNTFSFEPLIQKFHHLKKDYTS